MVALLAMPIFFLFFFLKNILGCSGAACISLRGFHLLKKILMISKISNLWHIPPEVCCKIVCRGAGRKKFDFLLVLEYCLGSFLPKAYSYLIYESTWVHIDSCGFWSVLEGEWELDNMKSSHKPSHRSSLSTSWDTRPLARVWVKRIYRFIM